MPYSRKKQLNSKSVPRKRHYATAAVGHSPLNNLHPADRHSQSQISHIDAHPDPSSIAADAKLKSISKGGNIREHLRLWQEIQDGNTDLSSPAQLPSTSRATTDHNLFTQSGEDDSFKVVDREHEAESFEDDEYIDFGSDNSAADVLKNELFLRKGDLVELL